MAPSPEVKKGEDEDPDEIDEVPIQAHYFDDLVASSPTREESSYLPVKVSTQHFSRRNDQEDHAERHMRPVKARNHKEA
jgi:hypothetical protein